MHERRADVVKNRSEAGPGAAGMRFIACVQAILFAGCLAASCSMGAMMVRGDTTAAGYTFLVLATLAGMYLMCGKPPAETLGGDAA